ncbi:hypothetical protein Dda_4942 [Drechslerella dactyloides]|uniref:Uncharacterized protein n=1 Tax=Drechslerella dactyloides TaxID=74499 RepID=A0AAD6IXW4_DREDA|nr:hypothetical protein Dda_4942 [Drechslerella dactyloides]
MRTSDDGLATKNHNAMRNPYRDSGYLEFEMADQADAARVPVRGSCLESGFGETMDAVDVDVDVNCLHPSNVSSIKTPTRSGKKPRHGLESRYPQPRIYRSLYTRTDCAPVEAAMKRVPVPFATASASTSTAGREKEKDGRVQESLCGWSSDAHQLVPEAGKRLDGVDGDIGLCGIPGGQHHKQEENTAQTDGDEVTAIRLAFRGREMLECDCGLSC